VAVVLLPDLFFLSLDLALQIQGLPETVSEVLSLFLGLDLQGLLPIVALLLVYRKNLIMRAFASILVRLEVPSHSVNLRF